MIIQTIDELEQLGYTIRQKNWTGYSMWVYLISPKGKSYRLICSENMFSIWAIMSNTDYEVEHGKINIIKGMNLTTYIDKEIIKKYEGTKTC